MAQCAVQLTLTGCRTASPPFPPASGLVQGIMGHGIHLEDPIIHRSDFIARSIHRCLSRDLDLTRCLNSRRRVRCLKHNPSKMIRQLDSEHRSHPSWWKSGCWTWTLTSRSQEGHLWLAPALVWLTHKLALFSVLVDCPNELQNLSKVHSARSTHWKHLCRPENEANLHQCNFLSTCSMWTSLLCTPQKKNKRKRKRIHFKRIVGPHRPSHSVAPPSTGSCPLWQLHPAVLFKSWPQKRKVKRNVKGEEFLSGKL